MQTETLKKAFQLWQFLASVHQEPHAADAIVVCCSYDLRVCDYACELVKSGVSNRLVLSGNTGNWTRHLWNVPEAHIFKQRAITNGISPELITLEDKSTNFGENIAFSSRLLPQADTLCFISKPNSLLRLALTAEIQCPDIDTCVCGPATAFPEDVSNVVGLFGLISEMVGDVQRIERYPQLGYQVSHPIPEEIAQACSYLIDKGFTQHLLGEQ